MINFYQLVATGRDRLERPVKRFSKKIFLSIEEAELHIPEFSGVAIGDGSSIDDIVTHLDIHIFELELVEGENNVDN